ncbi:serine integrase family protein [Actinophytocola algeriensis]|uniref:Resolvase-like protein n=1 Tax=Actinophytocola algeriensis TaxID=1768010 RepID=A0A7W7VHJ7_9PSEU|nr:recombinase family protein [Actinophytocola algeriensis]MBB4910587.1 hypothetical protein [Actinophytocola algeriensis]MBE1480425.1 hypothetical protein [Actinophytocola algeriensis]
MQQDWRSEQPSLVYGYFCLEEQDEAQVATWSRDITDFCLASGYRLGSIFIDRGVSPGNFARGGFVELLAALRLPEAFGVVVPTLAQLSTDTLIQQVLVQMVQLTDKQLFVSQQVNGSDPDVFASDGRDPAP